MAQYCREGWPEKGGIKGPVKRYYSVLSEISIIDGLLMRSKRLIIPSVLLKQVLEKIHTAHPGIGKCCEGPD